MRLTHTTLLVFLITTIVGVSCQKKGYFHDTGRQDPNFDGSVLNYLQSKPGTFDSVVKIIHLTGMDDVFSKESITFFAPADSSVRRTLEGVNYVLSLLGRPLVTRMEQIKPVVWKRQLCRYLFKTAKSMNDFPQLDPGNLSAFPGQIYGSYQGDLMNIGVIYNDAGGVQYAGYRQLLLSFIPSITAPRDYNSWYSAVAASVNITAGNGYVHVLRYPNHYFGFEPNQFLEDALDKGIDY